MLSFPRDFRRAGTFLLTATLACGGEDVPNPTGTCSARDDGSLIDYRTDGGGTWLPDCAHPLRREYWRVFAQSAARASVVPRLDGEPRLAPACADQGHALAPLVERHGLCRAAERQEDVARIASMSPDDAFQLTRFLHRALVFRPSDQRQGGIDPLPPPGHVLAACALPGDASLAFLQMCENERERRMSWHGWSLSYAAAAEELAVRLNALYGIR